MMTKTPQNSPKGHSLFYIDGSGMGTLPKLIYRADEVGIMGHPKANLNI